MRLSAGLVIATGLIGLVLLQRQRELSSAQQPSPDAAPSAAIADGPVPAAVAQANPQHWPKRVLDRAADVKRQVANQRKSDETR